MGIWSLAAYGSLAAPLSIVFTPLILFLPPMYATEVGLSLTTVGLLFLLARFWDAVTDPIVGRLCDRWQFSFGRRKVWILCTAPLLMLMAWLFFQPPAGVSAVYLLCMILLFYPVWTMVMIPYQSWGIELSQNYQQRTRIAGFREIASMIGTTAVLGVPMFLLDAGGATKREVLGLMCGMFLVFFPVAVMLALWKTPDKSGSRVSPRVNLRELLQVLWSNAPFVSIAGAYFIVQFAYGMYLSVIQLFIISALGLGKDFLLLVFIKHIIAILCVGFWVRVSRRLGKHIAYGICLLLTAVALVAFSSIDPGNFVQALVLFVFLGIVTAPILVFPPAIVADTIDYGRWKTGNADTGLYMAILQLINKSALAMAIGVTFPLLDWAGFEEGGSNSALAWTVMHGLVSWVPALILLVAAVVIWRFPLTQRRLGGIQLRLASRERGQTASALNTP
ncbi:MFS transporter [Microbulbifer aggregans]|uniref:MFS transporter n=1 Tax=Microbulbifer aggregans TaxID=1769779 RepID=UPI001CFCF689|nr:MFS transporter [Microbulbifer aggregans]